MYNGLIGHAVLRLNIIHLVQAAPELLARCLNCLNVQITTFTLSIGTPYPLTILILKFENKKSIL